jgi:hypothetical protein
MDELPIPATTTRSKNYLKVQGWFTSEKIRRLAKWYVGIYLGFGIAAWLLFDGIDSAGIFGDMYGAFNAFVSPFEPFHDHHLDRAVSERWARPLVL